MPGAQRRHGLPPWRTFHGTDWLAFAHLVIAVAFYGPYAFGVFGVIPLYVVRRKIKRLEALSPYARPGTVPVPQ